MISHAFVAQGLEHCSCKPAVESLFFPRAIFIVILVFSPQWNIISRISPCIFPSVEYYSRISPGIFPSVEYYSRISPVYFPPSGILFQNFTVYFPHSGILFQNFHGITF